MNDYGQLSISEQTHKSQKLSKNIVMKRTGISKISHIHSNKFSDNFILRSDNSFFTFGKKYTWTIGKTNTHGFILRRC